MNSDAQLHKQGNRRGHHHLHDDEMQLQKWPGRKEAKREMLNFWSHACSSFFYRFLASHLIKME
jgi:hypothetical protein